jgi:hypothetical protein
MADLVVRLGSKFRTIARLIVIWRGTTEAVGALPFDSFQPLRLPACIGYRVRYGAVAVANPAQVGAGLFLFAGR